MGESVTSKQEKQTPKTKFDLRVKEQDLNTLVNES